MNHLLQFFTYSHLRDERMKVTSKQFAELAYKIADELPNNAELTTALRKLLEAKDCALRSIISTQKPA